MPVLLALDLDQRFLSTYKSIIVCGPQIPFLVESDDLIGKWTDQLSWIDALHMYLLLAVLNLGVLAVL